MSFSVKAAWERDYFGVDWTDELEDGETISTATVVVPGVLKGRGKDDTPSAIVSGASSTDAAIQSQLIIGGVEGVTYDTRWRITTSESRSLEESVPLMVR